VKNKIVFSKVKLKMVFFSIPISLKIATAIKLVPIVSIMKKFTQFDMIRDMRSIISSQFRHYFLYSNITSNHRSIISPFVAILDAVCANVAALCVTLTSISSIKPETTDAFALETAICSTHLQKRSSYTIPNTRRLQSSKRFTCRWLVPRAGFSARS